MKKIEYKYAVALTAALGLFMAVLDNTIVNVALTPMQKAFNTDVNTIQWVITGYFLSQAAVIPVAGYFSNRIGLKRTFIGALAIFTLGSLLCGLSPTFTSGSGGETLLIAFRILQGIGGGMLFPLATSISFGVFPPEERAASSALIAVPVLLAPTLGPTIGGLIADSSFGWEWIFFINVPIGIIAIALIARIMKPDAKAAEAGQGKRPSFDLIGLVLSMVGVVLVVYAFTLVSQTQPGTITQANPRGDIYGWSYWLVWTLLAAGIAVLVAFGFYETRVSKDPVLDLGLFRTYSFSVATIITWLVRAVIFGSFLLLPLFLEGLKGLSAVEAGLALAPQGLAAGIGIATGGRLYDRIGPRMLVILGLVLLTISSFMLVGINKDSDGWSFVPILLIRGVGFGWSNLPLQTVALSSITGRALPKASSLYNATAQIFSSIGISVMTTLFVQQTTNHVSDLVNTSRVAGQRPPTDLALQAGASGMSDVFLVVTIATALSILAALFLPSKSLKQQQATQANAEVAEEAPQHVAVME